MEKAGVLRRGIFPTMADARQDQWIRLWQHLAALGEYASRLRHLSQHEPLAQRRPGYPQPGLDRSHADEVREVLNGIQRRLGEIRPMIPAVLPSAATPGTAADERPEEIAKRLDTLSRVASTLAQEAFQPPPSLPPHAPPYLVEPPGHDLAGTKAVLLANGIEGLTASVRNLMLSAADPAE
jgi:hypothetical protein